MRVSLAHCSNSSSALILESKLSENVILAIVWYIPMSVESQTSVLLWLSRLSKYTLVDVFLVIGVLVGIQLRLKIGTVDVIMRGEPR